MDEKNLITYARVNKRYVFSVKEAKMVFSQSSGKTVDNLLQKYEKKGIIERLKKGLYSVKFPEGGPTIPDLFLANRMYEPSYVSLETALSFYNIIPEETAEVTSVTTGQTKVFKNKQGVFWYFSVKKEAFFGYILLNLEGFKVNIAEKEKALVDYIYLKMRRGEEIDVMEDRFDTDILKQLNWEKVKQYAKLYGVFVVSRVEKLKKENL
ncbi:MAG: hypothetical protein ABH873_04585 [Candidatus Firestonebacteria bacterium]